MEPSFSMIRPNSVCKNTEQTTFKTDVLTPNTMKNPSVMCLPLSASHPPINTQSTNDLIQDMFDVN